MRIEVADLVIPDFADIGRTSAKIGDADNGVGRRTAGHFSCRAHIPIDRGGAGLVDQRHTAFRHAVRGEKTLVGPHQHVENRVAYAQNVVFCFSHSLNPFPGHDEGCDLSQATLI